MLLAGCVSTKPDATPLKTVVNESPNADRKTLLRAEAADWEGTPHEWGGTTRDGIDCSAFVQTVYKDLFTVDLPRTTSLQSKEGQAVLHNQLTVGDLVFYRIDSKTRHVGIYVGEDEFMHASKSEGVTISSIQDPYWERRFWTVRRILAPAADSLANPTDNPIDRSRSGW
ncbi:MAG: NlpC/P60 family protein [Bacteroidota bacterium]